MISNRRLDNKFNIFEGLTKNLFFVGISAIMCGGQVLIIFKGGAAFQIAEDGQTAAMWGIAIVLGFLSIPVGMLLRCVPDWILPALVPGFLKRRASRVPGLTISDEEADMYPEPLADLRDELKFLRRMKGGRLNNLKFAMQHPKEAIMGRSPSHSRDNSIAKEPPMPTEDNAAPMAPPTPDARHRSQRSSRSMSNSAVQAPTVMAGIVAAGVAAGWSPASKQPSNGGLEGELSRSEAGGGGRPSNAAEDSKKDETKPS